MAESQTEQELQGINMEMAGTSSEMMDHEAEIHSLKSQIAGLKAQMAETAYQMQRVYNNIQEQCPQLGLDGSGFRSIRELFLLSFSIY